MVIRKAGKCILSCNGKMCVNDSTETFREVICPYHLAQVFGLKVNIEMMDTQTTDYYIGPFLILDNSFQFEANTVVFPVREYIDNFLAINKVANSEYYKYKMNPRMNTYLLNLISSDVKLSLSEMRYQVEIIRNLFFENTVTEAPDKATVTYEGKINLAKNTEESNKSLLVEIEKRFRELDTIIATEDYHTLFQNITIMSTADNKLIPLDVFTPFMKFMIFNSLIDEHKLPITPEGGVGITCYVNLLYKKGIGLVTVHDLIHPAFLVIGGVITGNNNYYQLKVRAINKPAIKNHAHMYKKNLADNLRSSNVLNLQSDICW